MQERASLVLGHHRLASSGRHEGNKSPDAAHHEGVGPYCSRGSANAIVYRILLDATIDLYRSDLLVEVG